jgi:hypothetical protein
MVHVWWSLLVKILSIPLTIQLFIHHMHHYYAWRRPRIVTTLTAATAQTIIAPAIHQSMITPTICIQMKVTQAGNCVTTTALLFLPNAPCGQSHNSAFGLIIS